MIKISEKYYERAHAYMKQGDTDRTWDFLMRAVWAGSAKALDWVSCIPETPEEALKTIEELQKIKLDFPDSELSCQGSLDFEIGLLYEKLGVFEEEAFNSIHNAAELGHIKALPLLATYYEFGYGTERDYHAADFWREKYLANEGGVSKW